MSLQRPANDLQLLASEALVPEDVQQGSQALLAAVQGCFLSLPKRRAELCNIWLARHCLQLLLADTGGTSCSFASIVAGSGGRFPVFCSILHNRKNCGEAWLQQDNTVGNRICLDMSSKSRIREIATSPCCMHLSPPIRFHHKRLQLGWQMQMEASPLLHLVAGPDCLEPFMPKRPTVPAAERGPGHSLAQCPARWHL